MKMAKSILAATFFVFVLSYGAVVFADPLTDKIAEHFESSFAHEVTGEYNSALNDVLMILRIDPSHYIGNLRAGWLYYLKANYKDSIKYYNQAINLSQGAIEPELGLMLPLMAFRRWRKAEKLGEEIIKRIPRNYSAESRLAFIYFSRGKYNLAGQQYKKVLADYPSDLNMMLGLGWTYLRQGRKSEARAMFEKVLSIRRQNLNARAGLDAL